MTTWKDTLERVKTDPAISAIAKKYIELNEDYKETLLTIDECERELYKCGKDEVASHQLEIARKNRYAEISAMDALLEVFVEIVGTDYQTAWIILERYARKEVA